MKSLKLKMLAALIEYHWWQVDRLRKTSCHEKNQNIRDREDFHKFKAEQWSVIYEIYLGLRDYSGKIVA
ncbi:MAG: hypothetical protein ACI4VW_06840 [Acutalibacteraceae bacterium]